MLPTADTLPVRRTAFARVALVLLAVPSLALAGCTEDETPAAIVPHPDPVVALGDAFLREGTPPLLVVDFETNVDLNFSVRDALGSEVGSADGVDARESRAALELSRWDAVPDNGRDLEVTLRVQDAVTGAIVVDEPIDWAGSSVRVDSADVVDAGGAIHGVDVALVNEGDLPAYVDAVGVNAGGVVMPEVHVAEAGAGEDASALVVQPGDRLTLEVRGQDRRGRDKPVYPPGGEFNVTMDFAFKEGKTLTHAVPLSHGITIVEATPIQWDADGLVKAEITLEGAGDFPTAVGFVRWGIGTEKNEVETDDLGLGDPWIAEPGQVYEVTLRRDRGDIRPANGTNVTLDVELLDPTGQRVGLARTPLPDPAVETSSFTPRFACGDGTCTLVEMRLFLEALTETPAYLSAFRFTRDDTKDIERDDAFQVGAALGARERDFRFRVSLPGFVEGQDHDLLVEALWLDGTVAWAQTITVRAAEN